MFARNTAPKFLSRFRPFAPACLAVVLASCSDDGQVPVYPVSGTVKFGSEVPVGAQVVLHPVGPAAAENVVATGTVGPDGTFKVGTYDSADGAPAGEYKATLQWFKVVKGDGGVGRGPNVLPRNYADPAKTPVTLTVAEAATEVPPIVIKR